MSTVPARLRVLCSDCGERCQVSPIEILVHVGPRGRGYYRWVNHTLCPPHRAAWLDSVSRSAGMKGRAQL